MVRRVWNAAKQAQSIIGLAHMKVVVAWPERYEDVHENNVLERFRRLVAEFQPTYVIRLTADCPLLTCADILEAIETFETKYGVYFNNRKDGHDVQIFHTGVMNTRPNIEHVIQDIPNTGGVSVNTKTDLMRVRLYAR